MVKEYILFFDGSCNLCNGFVDLLVRYSFRGKIATLQGQTAKIVLPSEDREDLNSVVYWRENQIHREGSAIQWALKDSSGALKFFGKILSGIPLGLTNFFYETVANNRYKIFGTRTSCRLPSPEERSYFLD